MAEQDLADVPVEPAPDVDTGESTVPPQTESDKQDADTPAGEEDVPPEMNNGVAK